MSVRSLTSLMSKITDDYGFLCARKPMTVLHLGIIFGNLSVMLSGCCFLFRNLLQIKTLLYHQS